MTQTTKSLLSKKHRTMTEAAQVQTLVRIGKRALAHAEHLETTMTDYYARCGTPEERAQNVADAAKFRVKAQQAADEALALASASDSLDLRRKARLAGAGR